VSDRREDMPGKRTPLMNKCLHKYCEMLAEGFNDAGYDQRTVIAQFKEGFDVPWTMEAVKAIFRQVAHVMYGVNSTKELTNKEMIEVYDVVDARLAEITGVRMDWPSEESMARKSQPKQR